MNVEELTQDETLVLVGLLREVIQADHQYSEEERAQVRQLAATIGQDRFDAAIKEASLRFKSVDQLKEAARAVERVEAHRTILECLRRVAASDDLVEAEKKPLRWLDSWWKT